MHAVTVLLDSFRFDRTRRERRTRADQVFWLAGGPARGLAGQPQPQIANDKRPVNGTSVRRCTTRSRPEARTASSSSGIRSGRRVAESGRRAGNRPSRVSTIRSSQSAREHSPTGPATDLRVQRHGHGHRAPRTRRRRRSWFGRRPQSCSVLSPDPAARRAHPLLEGIGERGIHGPHDLRATQATHRIANRLNRKFGCRLVPTGPRGRSCLNQHDVPMSRYTA